MCVRMGGRRRWRAGEVTVSSAGPCCIPPAASPGAPHLRARAGGGGDSKPLQQGRGSRSPSARDTAQPPRWICELCFQRVWEAARHPPHVLPPLLGHPGAPPAPSPQARGRILSAQELIHIRIFMLFVFGRREQL